MNDSREVRWLRNELPLLVEKEVISPETSSRLAAYYESQDEKQGHTIFFLVSAILGSLLIGGGIIMLFAHNWDDLSRSQRTFLSFTPLIIAQCIFGYAFFKKRDSVAWTEGSAAFLFLMIASTIALISQTYNLGGQLDHFVLTWMLLGIPLIYLVNSSLITILYMAGIAWWAMLSDVVYESNAAAFYWVLLAAVIPHLIANIKSGKPQVRSNLLGWVFALSLLTSINWAMPASGTWYEYMLRSTLYAVLYMAGRAIYPNGTTIWARPFQTTALAALSVSLLTRTYNWSVFSRHSWRYEQGEAQPWVLQVASVILCLLFVAAFVYLLYRHRKNKTALNYYVVVYPVLALTGTLLYQIKLGEVSTILFNLYVLALGIHYLRCGIRMNILSLVNAGMFLLSALIVERFFDSNLDFIIKGLAFILVGSGFLIVNFTLVRKMKKHG
ncbi:MAG: DUF2157 domain-containing protein [Bacteroidia bacterium]